MSVARSAPKAPKGLDKDQQTLRVGLPCACGCGRRLPYVDPRIVRTGRPQRYVEASCRQRAHVAKREREAREAAERAAAERRRRVEADRDDARDILRDCPDVADWIRVYREALGWRAGAIDPELVRAVHKATAALQAGKLPGPADPGFLLPDPVAAYDRHPALTGAWRADDGDDEGEDGGDVDELDDEDDG